MNPFGLSGRRGASVKISPLSVLDFARLHRWWALRSRSCNRGTTLGCSLRKKCPLNRVAFCALGPGFTVTLSSVMASCMASAQIPACEPASRMSLGTLPRPHDGPRCVVQGQGPEELGCLCWNWLNAKCTMIQCVLLPANRIEVLDPDLAVHMLEHFVEVQAGILRHWEITVQTRHVCQTRGPRGRG